MFSQWWPHGRILPAAGRAQTKAKKTQATLQVELLEDRLTPSTLSYEQWQQQRFSVDDVPLANASVQASPVPQTVNQSFGSLIGLDRAFADFAYRGRGASIAVIDTGIDYNHPDLGGGWGRRVVAGYDFVNQDADPMDDDGHGTHVAGIIAGSSTSHSGVAPEANLIALKVLDATGSGSFGDVERALQWVIQHQAQYNIVAVNLSLGSGNYTTNPFTYLDDELAALRNRDVLVTAAAGNSFFTFGGRPGLSYPAVSADVVSVGAVWAKDVGQVSWMSGARDFSTGPDRIASFSQRSAGLSLLAPGGMITSTYLHGGYRVMAGTSMAAPVVAGAAALVREALLERGLPVGVDAVLNTLQASGMTIVDGDDEDDNVVNTGLSFKRVDVYAALCSIVGQNGLVRPSLAPIADQSIPLGGSAVVVLQAIPPQGRSLTYAAHLVTSVNSQLYQLREQLGLRYLGDYYFNAWGAQEKWLGSQNGTWYCLLPNGQLRRWAGTMNTSLNPDNLIATLAPSVYAEPSQLWNAQPAAPPPARLVLEGNVLTIIPAPNFAGTFQVAVTVCDGVATATRTFEVIVGNRPPVWTPISDQTMKPSEGQRVVILHAVDPEGSLVSYSATVVAISNSQAPAVGLALQDNRLTIKPSSNARGSFQVEVAASDGVNVATTSFIVTIENAAPTLGPIGDVTLKRGQQATITLKAFDPNGDPLTYSARVLPANAKAYELDQRLDLNYAGSYFQNFQGLKEKWLLSGSEAGYDANWYCILPNGEVRRRGATRAETMSTTNLVAKLDASYYARPELLWNAKPETPPVAEIKIVGNRLTIVPPAKFVGVLMLEAEVSDGSATVRRTFIVRVK
ncbi:MAG: S8 family serine peptidase [Gemmataceae bacterium]|nr:S8 family serine peptidase [Gemmataceae bacterium]